MDNVAFQRDNDAAGDEVSIPPAVAANVTMKLPVFWPDAAEVWFAQADSQFAIKNLTASRVKFYHAVAVLPQEVAVQLLDLIQTPPAVEPNKVLKERLITLNFLNDYQRFEALVSLTLSGDQTPSHPFSRQLQVCFSAVYLPMSDLNFSRRRIQSQTNQFLQEPILLVPAQFLPPDNQLLRLQPSMLPALLVPVGTTKSTETRLRAVGNPVPSRKTISPVGGSTGPTCKYC